jgi:hypothetical protein
MNCSLLPGPYLCRLSAVLWIQPFSADPDPTSQLDRILNPTVESSKANLYLAGNYVIAIGVGADIIFSYCLREVVVRSSKTLNK